MSVYLYTFDVEPKDCDGINVFRLKFRHGHAEDPITSTVTNNAYVRWNGRPLPTYYIEGNWKPGVFVYQITKPIVDPYWFDTDPMPGAGEVIGTLKRDGRGWKVEKNFAVEQRTVKVVDGWAHLTKDDKREVVNGLERCCYEMAKESAWGMQKMNRCEPGATSTTIFEVVPNEGGSHGSKILVSSCR